MVSIKQPRIAANSRDSGCRLFRFFYFFSTLLLIAILVGAGLGLRHVLRNLVDIEAERDAIRVSTAIRDHEIHPYIGERYMQHGMPN